MVNFNIGEISVTRVEDFIDQHVPPGFLLPDLREETLREHEHWLAPRFYDARANSFAIHIQSFLLRTRHHNILVDTCGGNCKPREHFPVFHMRNGPYLENLSAAGVAPEDIDFVFCTHLHIDHVGWNTRLEDGRWVPTFPNARYLFSKTDYEAFDPRGHDSDRHDEKDDIFVDSVLPVMEAGLAELVDGIFEVNEMMTIEPAPGHSPGHALLRVRDAGESALFTGDILHHPLQIACPELNSFACADPVLARATRRNTLERCACEGHLLVPGHFAAPHAGHVREAAGKFSFSPLNCAEVS
ncbi:MBL fold metallo-hydrolase [Acidocella sp.]|uniref:MBL fold metallo-hydrolase n=1 Tax=Acidocella sp. TaxID=50710 RepID=UPI003CFD3329